MAVIVAGSPLIYVFYLIFLLKLGHSALKEPTSSMPQFDVLSRQTYSALELDGDKVTRCLRDIRK